MLSAQVISYIITNLAWNVCTNHTLFAIIYLLVIFSLFSRLAFVKKKSLSDYRSIPSSLFIPSAWNQIGNLWFTFSHNITFDLIFILQFILSQWNHKRNAMDALRKQASKLREQVAKQQQVSILVLFSTHFASLHFSVF